jgi:hypothetical protein
MTPSATEKKTDSPHQVKSQEKRITSQGMDVVAGKFKSLKSRIVQTASAQRSRLQQSPEKKMAALKGKINTFISAVQNGNDVTSPLKSLTTSASKIVSSSASLSQILDGQLNDYLSQTPLKDVLAFNTALQTLQNIKPAHEKILSVFRDGVEVHLRMLRTTVPALHVHLSLTSTLMRNYEVQLKQAEKSELESTAPMLADSKKAPEKSTKQDISLACWRDLDRARFEFKGADEQINLLYVKADSADVHQCKLKSIDRLRVLANSDSALMLRSTTHAHQGIFAPFLTLLQENSDGLSPLGLPEETLAKTESGQHILLPKNTMYFPRGGTENIRYLLSNNGMGGIKIQADYERIHCNRYDEDGMGSEDPVKINSNKSTFALHLELDIQKEGLLTLEKAEIALNIDFSDQEQSGKKAGLESKDAG